MTDRVSVIGAGLAGVEAAYQICKRGVDVDLYEMRPDHMTEAHQTGLLAEMVCSNSLGSTDMASASGLLKEELKHLGSFFLSEAEKTRVPAGNSLSVDRMVLSERITREIGSESGIRLIRKEIKNIDDIPGLAIVATGPLTSPDFSESLTRITSRKNLFFFDATSPIIRSNSIDFSKLYRASRYDKGTADFVNIPLDKNAYDKFVTELVTAGTVEEREFEKTDFFEYCLPVEEIARRGNQSLAFGTLRPVGLEDPRAKKLPYAVVQLRQDDLQSHFYQMVGFQTRLKQNEQKRIFRTLPGLGKARFERYGRMHRNTYINAPLIINSFLQCKNRGTVFFAGQICGVEGYVESIASGLIAGIYAARKLLNKPLIPLPDTTACGSLIHYITQSDWKNFKPTKFTFGLLPDNPDMNASLISRGRRKIDKKRKKEIKASMALKRLDEWLLKIGI
jgi:methylenetetrahydrofolate--tRNA-(uracil-5-)-methyltransferase